MKVDFRGGGRFDQGMAWVIGFATLALVGAIGTVVSVNRVRSDRLVAEERRALLLVRPSVLPRAPEAALPAPVERYRALAVGERQPVRTMRLKHGGTFALKAGGKPLAIRGEQLFTADPPGFLWTGHISVAPGLWVDARDRSVEGVGSMRVLLESTVRLADASGPELNQGSALRLLAELVWLPTALFDGRYVTWAALDDQRATATLKVGGCEVSAVFTFGTDGLPASVEARRYMDKGGLLPWGGVYRDYRIVSGLRVPFEADVSWQLPAGPFTYARWIVDAIELDGPEVR